MVTTAATTSGSRPGGRKRARGFTLLEMMVVIGLITLMASMALPSVIALFNAGADAQAYNLVSAQLTAARARAVVSNTYAGIHVQLADVLYSDMYGTTSSSGELLRPELEDVSFSGLIVYDSEQKYFDLLSGTAPQRVPGSIVFGYASEEIPNQTGSLRPGYLDATLSSSASTNNPFVGSGSEDTGNGVNNVSKFTTFSVVFNPLGAVTRFANGEPIHFNDKSPIFADSMDSTYGTRRLWRMTNTTNSNNYVQDRYGVTALAMFNINEYRAANDTSGSKYSSKADFLNEEVRILPLNVHTGLLFERK